MVDPSGWMPGAEKIETSAWGYPDLGEEQMYPQAVVNHVAQGYMQGLINIAQSPDPGKSWHFSVGRDGRIVQHVSIWNPAWHAGDVNAPSWPLYADLAAQLGRSNPNRMTIGIEQEGFSVDPGYAYDYIYDAEHPWPEAQIASLIKIHEWFFGACGWLKGKGDADHVITHSMLNARSRAQDPGDFWLATVRPRILAALQPGAIPGPSTASYDSGYADGRRDGRAAMLDAVAAAVEALRAQP